MTSPSCGFSFAVSGITRPDDVISSASSERIPTRSSRGSMLVLVFVATVYYLLDSWERTTVSTLAGRVPERQMREGFAQPGGPLAWALVLPSPQARGASPRPPGRRGAP